MELQEKKKVMPTITHYLSDNDEVDLDQPNKMVVQTQSLNNYAEWKKQNKEQSKTPENGKRKNRIKSDGTMEPLGDISSGDENDIVHDDEPLRNVFSHLMNEMVNRKSSGRVRKKSKKPSKYLLFCRMKHQEYRSSGRDWSFSELCKICQTVWENTQNNEHEEDLEIMIEDEFDEYEKKLRELRKSFLAEINSMSKSELASIKSRCKSQLTEPDNRKSQADVIPERLANLAGSASIYHSPQVKRNTNKKTSMGGRHSIYSYRQLSSDLLDTNNEDEEADSVEFQSLDLNNASVDKLSNHSSSSNSAGSSSDDVTSNSNIRMLQRLEVDSDCETKKLSCARSGCNSQAVEDDRWNCEYCSASCLIKHCREVFDHWLIKRASVDDGKINLSSLNNNNNSDADSVDSDDELFAALQSQYNGKQDNYNSNSTPMNNPHSDDNRALDKSQDYPDQSISSIPVEDNPSLQQISKDQQNNELLKSPNLLQSQPNATNIESF